MMLIGAELKKQLNRCPKNKKRLILMIKNVEVQIPRTMVLRAMLTHRQYHCVNCNAPLVGLTFDKHYPNRFEPKRPYVKPVLWALKKSKLVPLTCDHKHPLSRGGKKLKTDNLQVMCLECNKEKGAYLDEEIY